MLPTITNAVRKAGRLLTAAPVALALLFVALPAYGGTPGARGAEAPEATCPAGGQCFADVPSGNPFYEFANRLYMQNIITGYPCGGPGEPCDAENRPYYRPGDLVTRQQMSKFVDQARRQPGFYIDSAYNLPFYSRTTATGGVGVYGESTTYSGTGVRGFNSIGDGVHGVSTGNSSAGVHGESSAGVGVHGVSTKSDGVWGLSTDGYGVHGKSSSVAGVYGESVGAGVFAVGVAGYSASGDGVRGQSSTGYGVYGYSSSSWAGYFQGNINVTGNCTGCAGPTRMDHPLDPENKYLYHSTVQSPDMKNVYDGNVTTDEYGEAVVVLPDYFEAFNRDFRYQLTVVGRFAQAIISQQVKDNRFTIKTDKPFVTVSWQVTGIRQDPYANAHRSPVEEDKPAGERGKYLHPTEWGQPESKGIDYEEQRRMQAVMKP